MDKIRIHVLRTGEVRVSTQMSRNPLICSTPARRGCCASMKPVG